MTPHERISLKSVTHPLIGSFVSAPPILIASDHTTDYACSVAPY